MSAPNGQDEIKRSKPNYLYAISSVSLVLVLLGFFGLMFIHTRELVSVYKEKLNIIVEIEKQADQASILQLKSKIKKKNFAKAETVKHITKEEGLQLLEEDFGEEFIKLDMINPLFDVITFNAKATYMNEEGLAEIRKDLKANEIIRDVYYQESLVSTLLENVEKLGFIAIAISLFFIFVAIYLIHSTIKLALYANRFLIKNMELVGASWEFISRPYLIRSVVNGLISAAVAIATLLLILGLVKVDFPELQQLQNTGALVLLFFLLIIIGVGITTASTYFVVNKYLRMRVDDMY